MSMLGHVTDSLLNRQGIINQLLGSGIVGTGNGSIDLIRPNRYQPRQHFSDDDLEELGNSIKAQGIIQPLLVRRIDHGYELVAGERRLRAARKVGLTKVPVVYRNVSDAELLDAYSRAVTAVVDAVGARLRGHASLRTPRSRWT